MRQYKIILMLLVAALLFTISCSDQPTKPKEKDRVSLTLEDVAIHEVWIKVTVDTTLIGNAIQIFKDDKLAGFIERNKMTRKDTILWTSYYPTEPSTSYQYQAVVVNEEFEELAKSKVLEATTLTPTSNDISWQVDTIGTWQTHLNCVWGNSPTDVYVGGAIRLPTRDRVYNMIHWDGLTWTSIDSFNGKPNLVGEPLTMYGFGEEDLWVAGRRYAGSYTEFPNGFIAHWDGAKWQQWEFDHYSFINGLWGNSSDNIYAVGQKGLILHYDGVNWSQMNSGTSLFLRDIHGTEGQTYIVGGSSSTGEGIMLELKNGKWEIVYKGTYDAGYYGGVSSSVWSVSPYRTYIYNTGGGVVAKNRNVLSYGGIYDFGTMVNKIRGTGYNNIFAVGHFGLLIHLNGLEDRLYPFYEKPGGDIMDDVIVFENSVFVVGYSNGLGTIYRGTF
jgi:hypothetical protein